MQQKFRDRFPQEFPLTPDEAFLASGRCFFDTKTLHELSIKCQQVEPIVISDNGCLKIYENPISDHEYIIGVDVGEGLQGGDYSGAGVIDYQTGAQKFYAEACPSRL